jgi:hypothetical protein
MAQRLRDLFKGTQLIHGGEDVSAPRLKGGGAGVE